MKRPTASKGLPGGDDRCREDSYPAIWGLNNDNFIRLAIDDCLIIYISQREFYRNRFTVPIMVLNLGYAKTYFDDTDGKLVPRRLLVSRSTNFNVILNEAVRFN